MTRLPVVLGLDFGGTKIAVAVCDLAGARLGTITVDSFPDDGASAAMERAVAAGRALLETAAPQGLLCAVGAATFGIPFDDRVELAPTIPGWEDLAFGRELKAAFPGVPVELATDVKAAAQAEARWGALVGSDPGLYLNLGTGLAAAVVVGGAVVTGAHRAAGEIGYNVRDVSDVGAPLAQRITLEDVVSGKALAALASTELRRPSTTTQQRHNWCAAAAKSAPRTNAQHLTRAAPRARRQQGSIRSHYRRISSARERPAPACVHSIHIGRTG
jgi:glucokinase